MKCCNCESCTKGFFKSRPDDYVCIGVKEPFIIENINSECSEYNEEYWDNRYKNLKNKINMLEFDKIVMLDFIEENGLEENWSDYLESINYEESVRELFYNSNMI